MTRKVVRMEGQWRRLSLKLRFATATRPATLPPMAFPSHQQIKDSLDKLYLDDPRPRLVGFSRGDRVAQGTRQHNSDGLLASGHRAGRDLEKLTEFSGTLLFSQDPVHGKRDLKRKNGSDCPAPPQVEACRELLTCLLQLQEETGLTLTRDN